MQKNKTIISIGKERPGNELYSVNIPQAEVQQPGLWMEFDDSFIQLLSGVEPVKIYYSSNKKQHQSIAC